MTQGKDSVDIFFDNFLHWARLGGPWLLLAAGLTTCYGHYGWATAILVVALLLGLVCFLPTDD